MKLYMHPVSMTSRPVRLFIAESGIDVDEQMIDLMTGEHYQEPYVAINPNRLVPVLDDGDFRLTESSAILKYLADKIDSPAYPKKKAGDKVARDEPIFEISTDKVDAEIPSPSAGTLVEIKVKEGETVPINTVVALLETEAGAAAEAPKSAPAPQSAASVPAPNHLLE